MNEEITTTNDNFINENLELQKIQLKPIEKLKIPIDITTQNAMNITIPAGKEKTIDRIIYDIPEGITTDQIIKQGLKKESRFFKNLTLKPQNPDITADDIVNFGVNANLFKTTLDRVVFSPTDNHILTEYEYKWTVENNDLVPYLRLDDGSIGEKCIVALKEIPIVPKGQNGSVDISEIIKQGIQKGVLAFEELPIMAVDKSDEYILELAKKDGFFKCKVITEGTGIFSDSFKNVKFYESRAKNIMSYLRFLVQNADSETRIDEFDYGVLSACFTEISNGNDYTTPNRIFHILGGGQNLYPSMRQKILDSLTKLRKVTLQLFLNENSFKKNIIDADQQSKFNKDTNVSFQGYLLPNEVFTAKVNGKIVNDTIHLLNGGALRINSEARKQILTCDPELAHPPVRTTDGTIATTHFLLRRSLSIIGSNDQDRKHISRLRNIITLDDLYSHVSAETTREQQHARETALKILDFFVEKDLLKSYKVEKKDNGKIYSIVIQF